MKKKENGLICILKGFHGGQMTEKELYEEFVNLARQLFFDGHFEVAVEGKCNRKIYLQAIEFYYHEEDENGIKDPVMYHSNDHEKRELPYFEIGRFNMHQSGVDVTFENPQKHYRASFLIRAYSFEPNPTEKKKCEVRSTHIYDDMFFMGVPMDKSIEITWANDNEDSSNWKSNGMWRLNVADYEKDEKGKYIKKNSKGERDDKKGSYHKIEEKAGENSFSYSGKIYRKCTRNWRFVKNKELFDK